MENDDDIVRYTLAEISVMPSPFLGAWISVPEASPTGRVPLDDIAHKGPAKGMSPTFPANHRSTTYYEAANNEPNDGTPTRYLDHVL